MNIKSKSLSDLKAPEGNIRFVTDQNGEVISVQVDIAYFQNLLDKAHENDHFQAMEDAIREIYELEKGTIPKISLSSFLEEI